MAINWPAKDPNETLGYSLDWTAAIGAAPIVTSVLIVISGDATIVSTSFAGGIVSAIITGGVDQVPTVFQSTITYAGGTLEETINLPIISSAYPVGPSTSTKRMIVTMAYEEASLSGYEFDITPEEQFSALRRLDGLMAEWQQQGIALGYNFPATFGQGALDSPSGIPDYAVNVAAMYLALRVYPLMGKSITPEAKYALAAGMVMLRAATAVVPTSLLPIGTIRGIGNKPWALYRPFLLSAV